MSNVAIFCAYVQTTQIYTESPQATVDKHIREWNEMNFPRSIYIDEKDLEERNVPDFLDIIIREDFLEVLISGLSKRLSRIIILF